MEYINASFEIKSFEETDVDNYTIVGYASTFGNVDLGNDIVMKGAFADDLKACNTKTILWQHKMDQPIGKGCFTEDDKGLKVEIKLPKSDSFVRERVIPQVKVGSIQGMSIGYMVDEYEYEGNIRLLKKLTLLENSLVSIPMNPKAEIESVKKMEEMEKAVSGKMLSIGTDSAWDKNKSIKQIREFTGSEDKPSATYKNGFMYYDKEDSENFSAYKLPYIYVEDGKMKANPRALSAIVGAISGARGGLKIPNEDKSKIKSLLNKYYEIMEREKPFKSDGKTLIDNITIQYLEERDCEKLFDDDIIVSKAAVKYAAGVLGTKEIAHDTEEESKALTEFKETLKQFNQNFNKGENNE